MRYNSKMIGIWQNDNVNHNEQISYTNIHNYLCWCVIIFIISIVVMITQCIRLLGQYIVSILSYEYMASDSNQVLFGRIYMYMHNHYIDS